MRVQHDTEAFRQHILELSARPGGATLKDAGSTGGDWMSKLVIGLIADGRLFKAKISHKSVRHYATREAAELALTKAIADAGFAANVSITGLRFRPDAVVSYHPEFKRTICPSPAAALRSNTYAEM